MRQIYKLTLLAALIGLTVSAQAAMIPLFNTGVDAGRVVLANGITPDPHYSLSSVPSGSSTTLVLAYTGGGWPISPAGPWIADNSISRWIRPNNVGTTGNDNDPVGLYVFRTTFDLAGLNPATAAINGQWATDNSGSMKLNGNVVGTASGGYTSWTAFSILSGFLPGVNTLEFFVKNADGASGNPTGLRVEMTGFAAVPEPTTIIAGALLLLPFGASTIRMLRKHHTA